MIEPERVSATLKARADRSGLSIVELESCGWISDPFQSHAGKDRLLHTTVRTRRGEAYVLSDVRLRGDFA